MLTQLIMCPRSTPKKSTQNFNSHQYMLMEFVCTGSTPNSCIQRIERKMSKINYGKWILHNKSEIIEVLKLYIHELFTNEYTLLLPWYGVMWFDVLFMNNTLYMVQNIFFFLQYMLDPANNWCDLMIYMYPKQRIIQITEVVSALIHVKYVLFYTKVHVTNYM